MFARIILGLSVVWLAPSAIGSAPSWVESGRLAVS